MNDPFEDRFQNLEMKQIANSFGVLCLSKQYDEQRNILTEPLMWAHYANNHSGIAIGLKENSVIPKPFKVEYIEEDEIDKRIDKFVSENNNRDIHLATALFKYKPKFWSYENEYREVFIKSANQYIDPKLEINEIIFGFRSRPEDELAIWSALRDNIVYKKAFNRNGRIEIMPYEPPRTIKTGNNLLLITEDYLQKIADKEIKGIKEVKGIKKSDYKYE
jgi:hypothetical protein